ncbi:MAG: 1-(5-phosphoribosyl)-5-[(5-phosphoribosylamino)methylideneamino]imidazole-4-carboxamide isomerase [Sphingobacteriaceae bacterium]
MRIIPAIDIINGKCVRLSKGDYATEKVYAENPLDMAKSFEDYGIKYLHLVDLDGAKSKHVVNQHVLNEIASKTSLKVDFGGGLKSREDIQVAFDNGASQITLGSLAIADPELFMECLNIYGPDRIILGADCNNRKIATHGWLAASDLDVLDFIQNYQEKGIQSVICTDIAKDGMLAGPAIELYREIIQQTGINLIASGGVSNLNDLQLLKETGCEGAIVGKAIYENKISLKELSELC